MRLLQKLKWCAGTLFLLLGFGCPTLGLAQDTPLYEENTLYVKFKDNSGISAKKMLSGKNGKKDIETSFLGFSANLISRFKINSEALSMSCFDNPVLDKTFMISVDPAAKSDITRLKEELEKLPEVEYVERVPFNRIFSVEPTKSEAPVNDPFYGKVAEASMNVSWHLDLIHAEQAWELQTGNPNLLVAVVDNAIWGEHEDLQIPSSRQYNCATRTPYSSAPPQNYVNQDEQCQYADIFQSACIPYEFSHGTHCAGAIAAINNNGVGIASIGGGVSLMSAGGPSMQRPSAIVNGYHGVSWAAEHGAKLVSCSWGSEVSSFTDEATMKTVYEKGVIVITAAGNDNVSTPHYPAAYAPYVISVGSVDAGKTKSNFSNHGYWIDILSPGGEDTTQYKTQIFSTTFCQNQYTRLVGGKEDFTGKYYDEMSGTSMATPVLAGVVALLLSKDSTLTTDQVRNILQNSGQDLARRDPRFNDYCKIVDAYAALRYLSEKPKFGPQLPKSTISSFSSHDSVWIEWKATETTEPIEGYRIYRNGKIIDTIATSQYSLKFDTLQSDTIMVIDTLHMYAFLDIDQSPGTIRYAIEPLYKNMQSLRTEVNVTVNTYFHINVMVQPSNECGTIEGSGQYKSGDIFTLKAHPAAGYAFDYWNDESGVRFANSTLSAPALANRLFFAFFKQIEQNDSQKQVDNAVRISPNPASDEITIQCLDYAISHIRITDMQGRVVYDAECQTNELTIGIGSWAQGTYIVQATTSAGMTSQKLIKR